MSPDPRRRPIPPLPYLADGRRRRPWVRLLVWSPALVGVLALAVAGGAYLRAARFEAREKARAEEVDRAMRLRNAQQIGKMLARERQQATRPSPATRPAH